MKYIRIILLSALISTFIAPPATYAAYENIFSKVKSDSDKPVIVKGDKVEYSRSHKSVTGEGNVSIIYGDVKLECDKIIVYTDTKEAICEGNVKISQPNLTLEGDKINYNFEEKKGYIIYGDIKATPFVHEENRIIFCKSEHIEQLDKDHINFSKGYVTTCDLDKPHWRIQAKEIRIYLDREVKAYNVFIYVGNIPIFYMPIYVQPLIEGWPEVTIVPGRTYDWGNYVLTAWRYYINKNSQGNIHLDYRDKKGIGYGVDYKYDTEELGEGIARVYYTHENDKWAYRDSGYEDDRWRMQYMHMVDLPENSRCTVEINKLSDDEVMKDYFERENEENPEPDNYILFETAKSNYFISIIARPRLNTFFTVVEKMPEAKLTINNQRLWNTNFYYTSENTITNFIKRYNDYYRTPSTHDQPPDRAVRIDNYYKFSYSAKLLNFLYVTPYLATRQTYYSKNPHKQGRSFRSLYEEGVDISTKFYRIFDIKTNLLGLDIDKLRHIITPSAGYLHRGDPTVPSSHLFQFDSVDNINYYNGFSLSLENKLQTKRMYEDKLTTVDLARLLITTDYTFRLKKGNLQSQGIGKFGDVAYKLDFYPYSWLSVNSEMVTGWSKQEKKYKVRTLDTDVYANLGDKFTFGLGHRYESTNTEINSLLTGEATWKINDKWKLMVYQRYDITDEKWKEQEYIILRDLHCWTVEAAYNVKNYIRNYSDGDFPHAEHNFWVIFRLKAFPKVPLGLLKRTYHRPHPGARYED